MKTPRIIKTECQLSPQDIEMHWLAIAFLLAMLTVGVNYAFSLGFKLSIVFYIIAFIVTFTLLFKCHKCKK